MRNWIPEEDGQLLEMLRLDFNRAVIAKVLGRSEADIRVRAALLKVLQASDSGWNAARRSEKARPVATRV